MIVIRLLMQTVGLALQQIWANKVRALLTTLGILIGVAAVVFVSAATKGAEGYLLSEFKTIGANKVWIFPRMPQGQRDRYSWRQIRMTVKEIDGMMAAAPSLSALTPIMEMSTSVQYGQNYKDMVTVQAVRPSWFDIEQREVLQGRPLSQLDEDQRLNVCIINDKAIGELGLDRNPVGERVLVGGRAFFIVGVIETKAVSPMFGGDEARTEVYMPFATGSMLRSEPRMYAMATTKSPEQYEDAKAELTFHMRKVRGLKPEEPNTFGVEAIEQMIAQVRRVGQFLTGLTALLVGISLIVGGIGIMNIMLASVSERTREIGLRKAVGAKPAVVMLQFLVEAVTLCVVGGGVGLLIGFGLVLITRIWMPDAAVPWWAPTLSVGACAFTGIVAGMFPAIKAARLDPIVALRHE
ncbi:MAG: ABC transporter permease [Phycisphaerales bacterium]